MVARAAAGAEAVTRALALGPAVARLDVHLPEGRDAHAAAILDRADAAGARRRLEERELVERAKQILMRCAAATAAQASRILQRSSQTRSRRW